MSTNPQTTPSLTFDGFRGIDLRSSHVNPSSAQDILNFRIRADGSLEKRYGYRPVTSFGNTVRASWAGTVSGSSIAYFLLADQVVKFNFDTEETVTVGTVNSHVSKGFFFFYEGILYVNDGTALYQIQNDSLTPVQAYAPLIGKDWNNREPGEYYEQKNILSQRARISYVISDPPSNLLQTKDTVQSVEAVFLNGTKLPTDRYYIDQKFGTVNVTNLQAGDRVLLYVTLSDVNEEQHAKFNRSSCAIPFGKNLNNRLFFLDRNRSSTMLCSSYVPKKEREQVNRIYRNSAPLYIPQNAEVVIGNRQCAAQSAQPYYDRLLLFTEEDTWMANAEVSGDDEFPTTNISTSVGCATPGGSISIGNDIFSVGYHGLWKWESVNPSSGELRPTCISLPIDSLLTDEDYKSAILAHNRIENELWVYFPTRSDVFIYQLSLKLWYRFDKITPADFFSTDGHFGFIRANKLYLFDPTLRVDRTHTEDIPIQAEYLSGVSDFGTPSYKNLKRILMEGDFYRNKISVTFKVNTRYSVSSTFSRVDSRSPILSRCPFVRFRSLQLLLNCSDPFTLKLYRVSLLTR